MCWLYGTRDRGFSMNNETIEAINNIWFKCPDIEGHSRFVCPSHGYRHKALPPEDKLKEIIDLKINNEHNFTLNDLAALWKVGREYLSKNINAIYGSGNNIFSGSYVWTNKNYLEEVIETVTSNSDIKTVSTLLKEINYTRSKWLSFTRYYKDDPLLQVIYIKIEENKQTPPDKIKCYRCHTEKPVEQFYNSKHFKDGYARTCKECSKKIMKKHFDKRAALNKEGKIFVSEKFCTYCKETKSADKFDRQRGSTTGLQQYCKVCQRYLSKRSAYNSYKNARRENNNEGISI